ncbi:MAG TPA: acetyl-CoA carboxylase biotin carboxylase subunit [Thermodesulfobacteriota bacterium]|nr:acetyl-CoA carboxylase biotin carboxylase subunit [Thermodesulfobacteriota bacterium]
MFSKILVANRGEIAVRVIRACREMGIRSVAVFSTADRDALHVKLADESICIGPPPAKASYLNTAAIISAAEVTDAEAIHPGYGFLSENAAFAEMCESSGIRFIGPTPENIRLMGNKIEARETVARAGVPVLPGARQAIKSDQEALRLAKEIGFPVILKAAAGGGGRGMKVVHSGASLVNALLTAQSEAMAAFGNADVYLEKYLKQPRHVEIQILADNHGTILHLGERDCSIQRRHQKLVEEAPCPVLTPKLREKMGAAAIRAAKAVGYRNVGTVEFLLDGDGNFYFMEMNTRIQVEHPVTEAITGIDLVKEQIKAAYGERLRLRQKDVVFRGHAIEVRINAEDPFTFAPSPGRITAYHAPGGLGVRVESAAYQDYVVVPYYDSLVAKLICSGSDRAEALARLRGALEEFVIEGIRTTIPLHQRILADPEFVRGRVDTTFLERFLERSRQRESAPAAS